MGMGIQCDYLPIYLIRLWHWETDLVNDCMGSHLRRFGMTWCYVCRKAQGPERRWAKGKNPPKCHPCLNQAPRVSFFEWTNPDPEGFAFRTGAWMRFGPGRFSPPTV